MSLYQSEFDDDRFCNEKDLVLTTTPTPTTTTTTTLVALGVPFPDPKMSENLGGFFLLTQ